MKVIIFPFAGGNKYSFNYLKDNLSIENIELIVIEYPGRGDRINEPLKNSIKEILKYTLKQVIPEITKENYIIYGHSMGALIGYLICQKIQELNLSMPNKLVVSGKKTPAIKKEERLSDLPDNQFWKEVTKLGGIPEEIEKHPDLIKYFTPILKADFSCIENYQYNQHSPKLTIPIDVFYGSEEEIKQEEAEAWQEETTGVVNVTKLKGNHFFIFNHKEFFIEYFKNLQLNATI